MTRTGSEEFCNYVTEALNIIARLEELELKELAYDEFKELLVELRDVFTHLDSMLMEGQKSKTGFFEHQINTINFFMLLLNMGKITNTALFVTMFHDMAEIDKVKKLLLFIDRNYCRLEPL